ncbi:MAG TPA: MarR family transcriptional regulator [Ilumatobacteraceae bacterium]|jgi:DNA-binding MarR family transcriptional regulator
MGKNVNAIEVAQALRVSVGMLSRRLRQRTDDDDLTLPQSTALARLDRGGPMTSSDLARQERISAQSMGATLAGLEARGLVARRADPDDGRRIVMSITPAGRREMGNRRDARTARMAAGLVGFSEVELAQLLAVAPLIERLAESI